MKTSNQNLLNFRFQVNSHQMSTYQLLEEVFSEESRKKAGFYVFIKILGVIQTKSD